MSRIKIFQAYSSALAENRREFEIQINRKNKDWIERDTFLDLGMWVDFLDALSVTHLQDEYNKSIRECDVFAMLLSTKVGKYTEEEFEAAFRQFKFRSGQFIHRCVVPCALISPGQF